jgi:hypothetical protein
VLLVVENVAVGAFAGSVIPLALAVHFPFDLAFDATATLAATLATDIDVRAASTGDANQ